MINSSRVYTSRSSYILLRDTAPEAVKEAVKYLETVAAAHEHKLVVETIPYIRKFIVAPNLTDAQLRDEHLWRYTFANQKRTNVRSGRDLVLWLDEEGIPCAPISLSNQSRLISMLQ